jgi:hypothetical protein
VVADDKDVGSQLVKALIAAKKDFKVLAKNKVNPHFKNKYADLAAVYEAVDAALAKNGLTVMQPLCFDEKYGHVIKTELLHVSGERKESVYPLPGGVKSQELASAITYGRRYSLSSLLGIAADDDDDGEAAGDSRTPAPPRQQAEPPPKPAKAETANTGAWAGKVVKVESPSNGKWTLEGADGSEFVTVTPEHADVARSVVGKPGEVKIAYVVQATNNRKRIVSIEPKLEGGK